MKHDYTFKGRMCLLSAMLITPILYVNAKSLVIETEIEGTLAEKISEADKWEITELKVSGPLNAFDFRTLREMAGNDYNGEPTEGKLRKLDLADANIIGYKEDLPSENQSYFIDHAAGYIWMIGSDNKFNSNLFYQCSSLEELTLPATAYVIEALTGMGNLTIISVPDESQQLTVIDNVLYSKDKTILYYCPPLSAETSVTAPSETQTIFSNAFESVQNVEQMTFSNVKSVQSYAISYCFNLKSITFGSQLEELQESGIYGNYLLQSVTVAENNPYFKNIGSALTDKDGKVLYLYPVDENTSEVTFPDGIETIERGAFYSSNVKTISLPNSVRKVKAYALMSCTATERVYIGTGVDTLEPDFAFNMSSLIEYIVDAGNPNYKSIDGAIYSKDGKQCVLIPGGRKEYSIAEGTTSLDMVCLGSINTNIQCLTLPSTLTNCQTLCYSHPDLSAIYSKATVPPTGSSYPLFPFNVANITLYVPTGTLSDYQNGQLWRIFTDIQEFDFTDIESVTSGNEAYEVGRYSIDGKMLPAPAPGINIIKMSDGTVQKVLVPEYR